MIPFIQNLMDSLILMVLNVFIPLSLYDYSLDVVDKCTINTEELSVQGAVKFLHFFMNKVLLNIP